MLSIIPPRIKDPWQEPSPPKRTANNIFSYLSRESPREYLRSEEPEKVPQDICDKKPPQMISIIAPRIKSSYSTDQDSTPMGG